MSALFLTMILCAAPTASALLSPTGRSHGQETKCAACHSTQGWRDVRFNHDRTGFLLTGAHATARCQSCHPVDFTTPVARNCHGCHIDVHSGDLGSRCDECHDVSTWQSRIDIDAHRRTNFPLLGGHASLPCVECHVASPSRRFARATVDCNSCHRIDADRTRGTAVDHSVLGMGDGCQSCHGAFRFRPARFPTHDLCFVTSSGPHSAIACQSCHTALAGAAVVGSCNTGTAACTGCHEHRCSVAGGATETDRHHAEVPGYQCRDRKCYECHQGSEGRP